MSLSSRQRLKAALKGFFVALNSEARLPAEELLFRSGILRTIFFGISVRCWHFPSPLHGYFRRGSVVRPTVLTAEKAVAP